MERISIRNFGPIGEAEIEIKDINVFIGTTSSGKSTAAKLISIFKGSALREKPHFERFIKLLQDYNISFEIKENTRIRFEENGFYFEVSGESFSTNYEDAIKGAFFNPVYIPAERMFFPTFSQSIFGLISSNIALPRWLVDFGAKFEQARNSLTRYPIRFLNVQYEYDGSNDYISLPNDIKIKLSQASSGLQSVVPLILVVQFNTETGKSSEDFFVIEEPELNLYPSSQKDLIEFVAGRINQSNDKIIITTHSPYLLTSIDNLVQAQNAAVLNPSATEKIKALVPVQYWIDFNKLSCYYFDGGGCRSTLDEEMRSIGSSNIDDVSIKISEVFEQLLVLKYPD